MIFYVFPLFAFLFPLLPSSPAFLDCICLLCKVWSSSPTPFHSSSVPGLQSQYLWIILRSLGVSGAGCINGQEGGWSGRLGFRKRYPWCVCPPIFVYHYHYLSYHFHFLNKKDTLINHHHLVSECLNMPSFGPMVFTPPNFSFPLFLSVSQSPSLQKSWSPTQVFPCRTLIIFL